MELNDDLFQFDDEMCFLAGNLAISIQCDEVGGYNEILSKCMFFLFQSSCFIENGRLEAKNKNKL